ncbi:uncharacterized protein LOC118513664 isoform X7 [Anopheles stephensi]|uniref:uncharacterized protein LOC118513664 isoform X7 n=1 Tax=Anopheles stephensi TaxID=30069 RepID=UPI0016588E8C|nr:uncharacterized protein LOC118513664 isoform X7 [Anopheles stephensi]
MDVQDSQPLRTSFGPPVLDSLGTGTPTSGRRVRSPGDSGVSRKRRRLSRSSSSSSTTSSLAKVSRLSRGRDTFDVDAGYENDADDDDDDEDDEEEEDDEEDDGAAEEEEMEDEDETEGHTKSGQHVLPTEKDVSSHRKRRVSGHGGGVRALASGPVDGSCGEKNGEKSTPVGTADLNAPHQPHQLQHQHQQHPATNYQHYQQHQQQQHQQQQLRHNKRPKYDYTRDQMFEIFQPWVIRTYGDRAKTKTITLKKQARIIKTLGGLEMNNPDSSKFRFWVKTKGFTTTKPGNFQDIFTHQNIPENDGCMLYAPSGGLEPGQPYKKVAVVENFFEIIYGVHVSLGSRATRHAGQKRTYRTITETYAFLPREAVTKFLSLCSQCSKLTTKVYSPKSELKMAPRVDDGAITARRALSERIASSCSTRVEVELKCNKKAERSQSSLRYYELLRNLYENGKSNGSRNGGEVPTSGKLVSLTSNLGGNVNSTTGSVRTSRPASVGCEVLTGRGGVVVGSGNERGVVSASEREQVPGGVGLNNNRSEKGDDEKRRTTTAPVPITSTYLDVTRSFGLEDDDALNMDSISMPFNTETTENNGSTANTPSEDAYAGLIKDADKFKLMLLAWNYQNSAAAQNGAEGPDLATMTNLWQQYQNALAMTGKTNFNQLPTSAESPPAVPNMYQNLANREQESTSVSTIKSEPMTSVPKISPVPSTPTPDMNQMKLNIPSASASSTPTIPTTVPTISNFHDYNTGFSNRSQHYQNFMNSVNSSSTSSGATTNTTMSAAGTAAPTDLSMKRPILAHKLNSAEITAVKQLVTGYRESAAFLMRSADELENLLLQQQ